MNHILGIAAGVVGLAVIAAGMCVPIAILAMIVVQK